jgi:hypothetical protein
MSRSFVDVTTTLGAYMRLKEIYPEQKLFTFLLFRGQNPLFLLLPFYALDTLKPEYKRFVEERIEKGFGVFTYPEILLPFKRPFVHVCDGKLVLVSDYRQATDQKIRTKLE